MSYFALLAPVGTAIPRTLFGFTVVRSKGSLAIVDTGDEPDDSVLAAPAYAAGWQVLSTPLDEAGLDEFIPSSGLEEGFVAVATADLQGVVDNIDSGVKHADRDDAARKLERYL
jgi:hypothetical protein